MPRLSMITASATGSSTSAKSPFSTRQRTLVQDRPATNLTFVFDQLSDRLQGVLSDVRQRGKLSEDDVKKALREVRLALLEADVNFKVVKDFTESLRERLAGE